MEWWIWVLLIGTVIFLIVDWFIVMGFNPIHWKGGEKKDGEHQGK